MAVNILVLKEILKIISSLNCRKVPTYPRDKYTHKTKGKKLLPCCSEGENGYELVKREL